MINLHSLMIFNKMINNYSIFIMNNIYKVISKL